MTLTQRKRRGNPINVTIRRIKNEKLPIGQHLYSIRLDPKLAPIEHSLHTESTLELHHRPARNRCKKTHIQTSQPTTTQKTKPAENEKPRTKNQTRARSIPVLVVALSDHTHLVTAGTALERNPLTISETTETQSY